MSARLLYIVERWPHGWNICAAPGQTGVSLESMIETARLFPNECVIMVGLPHHFNASGHERTVVMTVATLEEGEAWKKAITESLKDQEPQYRWWKGWDVGRSSAAIFAVLSDKNFHRCANHLANRATPTDADDFGRCLRLVQSFAWRSRLKEVAARYADTHWPAIIKRWEEIAAALPPDQTRILRDITN